MKPHAILSLNIDRPLMNSMSSYVRLELIRTGETVEVRAVDPTTGHIFSQFTMPTLYFRDFVA